MQVHNILYFCYGGYNVPYTHTLKKNYNRPPHIFFSSSESKILSIKIHEYMNKPMSNSGSVSSAFQNACYISHRRSMSKGTKKGFKKSHFININLNVIL